MKKKIVIISSILLPLLLIGFAFFLYFYYHKGLAYDGDITGPVKSKISINRDNKGVPLIAVKSSEDLYFSLGYLHGQDRYNMMEYYRALAYGKISKIVGENGVILDRLSNVIGFSRKANEIKENLDDESQKNIKAYVEGVNTARRKSAKDTVFNRVWNESDVLSILILKEWANSFLNNKEFLFQFPESAKKTGIREVVPENKLSFFSEKERDSIFLINKIHDLVKTTIGTFNRGIAFYIPSKSTREEDHFTAFTYDSEIGLYPGWYPVTIQYKDFTIRGNTYAGLPFIFSGNNQNITFCGLNLNLDVQDLLIEEVRKLKDVVQYLSRFGWRTFEAIREPVPGEDSSAMNIIIWKTINGPILNDVFADEEYSTNVITIKSNFPGANYISSLFKIPFSKNIDDAGKAVKSIDSYPKVYIFGSNEYVVRAFSGKIPRRPLGENCFRPGVRSGWNGIIDISIHKNKTFFDTVISSYDTINLPRPLKQYSIDDNTRIERLQKLIDSNVKITEIIIEDFLKDNYSLDAEKFIPLFVTILKSNITPSARLARIYFSDWDYKMDSSRVSPTIYKTLLKHYMYETYGDNFPKQIDKMMKNYRYLIPKFYDMVKNGSAKLFDDIDTEEEEAYEKIFDRAFLQTVRYLNRQQGPYMDSWGWGKFHNGNFYIPIKKTSFFEKLLFKVKETDIDGDDSTINYSLTRLNLKPAAVTSLTGIFNSTVSKVKLNYSYSTNPLSRFYYGRKGSLDVINLNDIMNNYTITISPDK